MLHPVMVQEKIDNIKIHAKPHLGFPISSGGSTRRVGGLASAGRDRGSSIEQAAKLQPNEQKQLHRLGEDSHREL